MKKIYYFIISGILLAISFPPFPLFFTSFFAFIFLLLGVESYKEGEIKSIFWKLYLTFFIFNLSTLWWISSFQEQTDPFLMASGFAVDLFHPFILMIPMYFYLKIRSYFSRNISILLFPVIYTAFEYFHSVGELSYPWISIGNSQINNTYFVQIADLFGVWGITFIIAMVNSLILLSYYKYQETKQYDFVKITSILFLVIAPNIYGIVRVNNFEHEELKQNNESIKIAVLQPNINPWEKWSSGPIAQIDYLLRLQDSLSKHDDFDLAILPETSILRISDEFNKELNLSFLQNWVNKSNTSLLSGFIHTYEYKEGESRQLSARYDKYNDLWEESFNSAIMINPKDSLYKVYHKGKLTPFAERIPNLEYFNFLTEFISWGVGISAWGLGQEKFNLEYNKDGKKTKIASIICIESIYPDFCREFTEQGAEVLAIITNDAWYDGTPGPLQHYNIARMRAIENRRYIARSANSGISGFISPIGESLKEATIMSKEAISFDVPKLNEKSVYVFIGDVFAKILFVLSILLYLFVVIQKLKKGK
jgi:apolipoprotein N-acyltransferase